jgi:hypothetical protein
MAGRPDPGQNRPYLGLDLGDVVLAHMRQPRRERPRDRTPSSPHGPQKRHPLGRDLAGFDDLPLQLLSLELGKIPSNG